MGFNHFGELPVRFRTLPFQAVFPAGRVIDPLQHSTAAPPTKVLLGHRNGDITTHYPAPELEALIEAANRVCDRKSGKTPALVLLPA
jgi:hypothetical protein